MKYYFIILCINFASVCYSQKIKIAAAADLRYAMDEIVKQYKTNFPNADIDIIYGSSGNAFTQIVNGAPFDIYFSADIFYPQKLKEAGFTISEPKLYAIGRIVLWSSTIDVSKGLEILRTCTKTRIAVANPEHAPYGKRAIETLHHAGLYEQVKKQLIFGENISQTAQFCLTGNAEIGILALSIVLSPSISGKGKYFLIDDKFHQELKQAFVLLKHAINNTEAYRFADYIESKQARIIFENYGFTLP
ncbi:MAG: molybdate ABC transporter substrate-binding protein [Bacteroidales bacterium]